MAVKKITKKSAPKTDTKKLSPKAAVQALVAKKSSAKKPVVSKKAVKAINEALGDIPQADAGDPMVFGQAGSARGRIRAMLAECTHTDAEIAEAVGVPVRVVGRTRRRALKVKGIVFSKLVRGDNGDLVEAEARTVKADKKEPAAKKKIALKRVTDSLPE